MEQIKPLPENVLKDARYPRWPFLVAFVFIVLSIYGLASAFQHENKLDIEAWNALQQEQNKLDQLSHLYELRTELKVKFYDILTVEGFQQQKQQFSELQKVREEIVETTRFLQEVATEPEEQKLLFKHWDVIESGVSEQFYFQALILDIRDHELAEEVLYHNIIPMQDYADRTLSDYYEVVKKIFEQRKTEFLTEKFESNKTIYQLTYIAIALILIVFFAVFWFVKKANYQQRLFSEGLERQVELRTEELDQAQGQLKNSLASLESVLKAAPDGIISTDAKATILSVNDAVESLFGYKPEELIGQNVTVLIPHKFRENHPEFVKNFDVKRLEKSSLMGSTGRVSALHKDGHVFPVEAAIGAVKNNKIEGFTILIRDVSQNVSMELTMQQQKDLLEYLRQATNQFMIYKDLRDVADFLLEKALKITGSEYGFIGEVLYENGEPYLKTHALTNIAWDEATRKFYDENAPQGLVFKNMQTLFGEAIVTKRVVISNDAMNDRRGGGIPKGHPALNCFLGVPVFYADKLVGMFGLANRKGGYNEHLVELLKPFGQNYGSLIYVKRMLESQEELHQQVLDERNQAEKANQAKSEFLSSMSHELRTPLNAVLGFAQLLEFEDLSNEQLENVHEISKAGKHLLELINTVLDLSKIESGNMQLADEEFSLDRVIQECENLIKPIAEAKQVSLHFAEVPADITINSDRTRLKQVVINLLSNAVKYNLPQGKVIFDIEKPKDSVVLKFADTGRGIAPDRVDGLFQPFNRLGQEGGSIEGTGVGLSLSREIVHLMGGELSYQPVEPQGSCFILSLPLNKNG